VQHIWNDAQVLNHLHTAAAQNTPWHALMAKLPSLAAAYRNEHKGVEQQRDYTSG
jgi:hypothetical protein